MGYSADIVRKAENNCKKNRAKENLQSVMKECQILEKERFLRSGDITTGPEDPDSWTQPGEAAGGGEEGEEEEEGEDEEEEEEESENLDVNERVRRLEQKCKYIDDE